MGNGSNVHFACAWLYGLGSNPARLTTQTSAEAIPPPLRKSATSRSAPVPLTVNFPSLSVFVRLNASAPMDLTPVGPQGPTKGEAGGEAFQAARNPSRELPP